MSIINVQNASYCYKQGDDDSVVALKNITFKVEEGEFVAVVGTNGSGKSTLAKLLNGLLEPTDGEVWIDGMNTRDESKTFDVRRTAGMVFQNPDNQMVATIVEDDIAFGPENIGVPREEIIERVEWALKVVGMSEYRQKTATKMSGGQKQRIAIAGVLAMKPRVLILDESTSMLDPKGRRDVLKVARDLNADGMTVLHITHNMDEITDCSRVLVLSDGELKEDTSPRALFSRPETVTAYGLTLPPLVKLQQLLSIGGTPSDISLSESELVEAICRLK